MLQEGIYEKLITRAIRKKLNEFPSNKYYIKDDQKLDKEEAAHILSRYITNLVEKALEEFPEQNKIEEQIAFCNKILSFIEDEQAIDFEDEKILEDGRILSAIISKIGKNNAQLSHELERKLPLSGFVSSNLFTGSQSDAPLNNELGRDILSADRIYWMVAFIRWSGIRIFEDELKEFTSRENTSLKIITTTYMGASDARALEFLSSLPNTEIKVSYHTDLERLHTKAYIFERNSGEDTAYVGSSNLSKAALTRGKEWNIRVTNQENAHIIEKARATFEYHWNNHNYEDLKEGGIQKFKEALKIEKISDKEKPHYVQFSLLPFQKEILEQLSIERNYHGRNKNLIVAATGTGKTVISAFDFRRFLAGKNQTPNLLFIAHRKEILEQALITYRSVLGNNYRNFGQIWTGNHEPREGDLNHLFVSVQILHSRKAFFEERLAGDFFDFIVIDEAHHSQANTYRNIFELFNPEVLLGLTATPERMDGQSLLPDFNGKIAAEIRLPDALNLNLLSPFQYFCITDESVDLRNVKWNNGGYDTIELTTELSNEKRIELVVNAVNHYLADISQTKALCFCASQDHAQYMSDSLKQAGFKATYITSNSQKNSREAREDIRNELLKGNINFVCVVDIFNEGIDIPEINTVLFLRPTESLTVYLQQLGRGLRLSEGKEFLTVLDFVSQAHKNFNFSERFRALVGKTDQNIKEEIQQGFPHLPGGCHIKLEKLAKKFILNNIQNTIYNLQRLKKEVANFSNISSQPLTLKNFLNHYHLDIRTIYSKNNSSWYRLKHDAGLISLPKDDYYERLSSSLKRIVHIDSPNYLGFIKHLVDHGFHVDLNDRFNYLYALMFYYDLWQDELGKYGFKSLAEALEKINEYPDIVNEIKEIIACLEEMLHHQTKTVNLEFPNVLELHAQYSRDEIIAAFEKSTPEKRFPSQEGVIPLKEHNAELLFVTLNKSDKDFSPTTQYEDYAINELLFHWQSQNSASEDTKKGKSYIFQEDYGKTILLFVRDKKEDAFRMTAPFYFLGPVHYQEHKGAKPMSIKWKLEEPMPPYLVKRAVKMG